MKVETNIKVDFPNMLLIAGNGRNVGKTHFACRIIEHLSQQTEVTGIKISSHIHPYKQEDVLFQGNGFVIIQEKEITGKDSSLMLQAGAKQVYFVMAGQENLQDAFDVLQPILPRHAIVCESGGLHQVVNPGFFFFINRNGAELIKEEHLSHSPLLIENDGKDFNFNIKRISFPNQRLKMNHE